MPYVLIDFETRSACDLEACGAHVYSEHPTTEVLCMAWVHQDGRSGVWVPGDKLLCKDWTDVTIVAHNVSFEKSIWRNTLGWPEPAGWYDTMATCARKGLPLSLDEAGRALNLEQKKSPRGKELMAQLCWPQRDGNFNEDPDLHAEFREYCRQDVRAELELFQRTGNIGPEEYKVWCLDQKINERGVLLDRAYVQACRDLAARALPPIAEQFELLTGIAPSKGALSGATRRGKVLQWLHANGALVPDLKKETIDEVLNDQLVGQEILPDICDYALRLRQKLTSTSLAKLEAMQNTMGSDDAARWLLQYHGAGTGRWAGRLIQPQNFPRAKVKGANVDDVYSTIMFGDVGLASARFGCPIDLITTGLRHAIVARPGSVLCARDFSTIEARVVMGIAGARALNVFKDKTKDIYCENASQIFDTTVDKAIAKDENHPDHKQHAEWRQTGKNSVLGLGFQMGALKFKARYAKKQPIEFAQKVVAVYREDFAPEVPNLWRGLENAALDCVWRRRKTSAFGCEFRLVDQWLTLRLPSGRELFYFKPTPCRKTMPWSTDENVSIREAWKFMARKSGQWTWVDAYGGLLTENVVQACARDLMAQAMLRAEANGFRVILTVHDEIVCEADKGSGLDDKVLGEIMCEQPPWAKALGIPIASEGFTGDRYRK